jgi:hypothetical protein
VNGDVAEPAASAKLDTPMHTVDIQPTEQQFRTRLHGCAGAPAAKVETYVDWIKWTLTVNPAGSEQIARLLEVRQCRTLSPTEHRSYSCLLLSFRRLSMI